MKKLNKTIMLATKFKEWYASNEKKEYNSTNNKYYYDVFYELLIIQDGLCAYTEYRLVDQEKLQEIARKFIDGYCTLTEKPSIPAQIEHFSKQNKKESGWNWDNLFVVFGKVNHEKNNLEDKNGIDSILKPDIEEYSPAKYLDYDAKLHIFIPSKELEPSIAERVFKMIIVLGLNNDFIKMHRKAYLEGEKLNKENPKYIQQIHQFHTAYSMFQD